MALMFSALRDIPKGQAQLKDRFFKPPRYDIFEFHEKTLGIIGLGRIGRTFCHQARNRVKRVVAYDPYQPEEQFARYGAVPVDLNVLLEESAVISIHCNLTEETHHLINADAFSKIRNRPILINTARGPVIDGQALLAALNEDKLYGAALDVHETEPPGQDEEAIFCHERTITTGHYAWYSLESEENLKRRVAQNLVDLLDGKPVEDQLNP
jgi:D-3-phosphoglycerate dehydrogenase